MKTENKVRSEEAFQIEKNAKNRAYAFILSNGLLDRFSQFCKETSGIEDLHPFCKEVIKKIETTKSN
jgi:GTP1/Obg family GTP-binding protein